MRKLCIPTKIKLALAAFALTLFVLSLAYAGAGLFPFGQKTLAWGDMSQQVVPLLMEFQDILCGKAGMLMNLQNAGGMSFWGVFFFFLSSPFSFLVLLTDKAGIYLLVNILVALKLALAAAMVSCFFHREAPRLAPAVHLALCISYALSGYALLYYQNLVWLDILCLFPVIMLGFTILLDTGKAFLFTLGLTLALLVNYYLSYMIFLGLILFSAVFTGLCVPKLKRRKAAGKIGLGAILSLLLTAVVWFPSLLQYMASARTAGVTGNSGFFTRLTTTLPILICSAPAAALPLWVGQCRQSPRAKAIGICWGFTVLPLVVEPINKLWHLGSYQAFPARYGYMPVFFGLWFLARRLNSNTGRGRLPHWIFPLSLLPAFCLGVFLVIRQDLLSGYTHSLWVDPTAFGLLAALCVACLVPILFIGRGSNPRSASWVLMSVCLIQSAVHLSAFMCPTANTPETELGVIRASAPLEEGLYRVKTSKKFFPVNLLGATGSPALNHYTSLTDSRFLAVMKKLGYSSYWMETSSNGGTAISDILLSNRYQLDQDLNWTFTGSGGLGYCLPARALPSSLPTGSRFLIQNQLYRAITGGDHDAFTPYAPWKGNWEEREDGQLTTRPGALSWKISIAERETLYFDAFAHISTRLREPINDSFSISVNGKELAASYPTQGCNGILELGEFEHQDVSIEVKVVKEAQLTSFGVWGMKASAPKKLIQALGAANFRQKGELLVGNTSSLDGQALFLSVPLYPGMKVLVNGKERSPRVVLDCFMEISLPPGPCQITISYIPAGLLPGAAITGSALLLSTLARGIPRQLFRRLRRAWYRAAPKLLATAFAVVLLLIYLLPPALWAVG